MKYVTQRRERELQRRKEHRRNLLESKREAFVEEFDLDDADGPSILQRTEAEDLHFWCREQSWTFCPKCNKLAPRKLLPSFRSRCPMAPENACKCGQGVYTVPTVDNVPLLLQNLTEEFKFIDMQRNNARKPFLYEIFSAAEYDSTTMCESTIKGQSNRANGKILYMHKVLSPVQDLVWVKDVSVIRANLLKASIPWENAEDAFVVADTQKSDRSSLPLNLQPNSFVEDNHGVAHLQFYYGEEEAKRIIRTYLTTILGALKCRTDVQLADGKGMLLKYVSLYVRKMHEAATSEGLYCTDLTGSQVAHTFLHTGSPL